MPRTNADGLPEPGDDSALVAQIDAANPERTITPTPRPDAPAATPARRTIAPQPEPAEQPDPPKGTPPRNEGEDKKLREQQYVAVTDVGVFTAGQDIPKDHWSPVRLRTLLESGQIRVKESK